MQKRHKEFILIGAILLIAGGFFVFNRINSNKNADEITTVQVRYKDTVLHEFNIDEDGIHEVEVDLGHLYVEIKDSQYRVIDVDCPDKICEEVGWVKKGSEKLIVCLPNNIVLVQA